MSEIATIPVPKPDPAESSSDDSAGEEEQEKKEKKVVAKVKKESKSRASASSDDDADDKTVKEEKKKVSSKSAPKKAAAGKKTNKKKKKSPDDVEVIAAEAAAWLANPLSIVLNATVSQHIKAKELAQEIGLHKALTAKLEKATNGTNGLSLCPEQLARWDGVYKEIYENILVAELANEEEDKEAAKVDDLWKVRMTHIKRELRAKPNKGSSKGFSKKASSKSSPKAGAKSPKAGSGKGRGSSATPKTLASWVKLLRLVEDSERAQRYWPELTKRRGNANQDYGVEQYLETLRANPATAMHVPALAEILSRKRKRT